MILNVCIGGDCTQATVRHVYSSRQRNGVSCQHESGTQRLGSKELHVSWPVGEIKLVVVHCNKFEDGCNGLLFNAGLMHTL